MRRRAVLATLGSGADLAVRQVAQFVVAVILARLLTPEDFGAIALLGLVVFVGVVASEMGLSTALLQNADTPREDLDVAFLIALVGGVTGTAAAAALAVPLAAAFGLGHLAPVAAFMSLAVLATAAGHVPTTELVRRSQFGRLLVTGLAAVLVGGGAAIALAVRGAGVWSLAVMTVLTPVVVSLGAVVACPVRVRPRWDRSRATRLLSLGRWVLATNALDAAWTRVQYALVGGLFGAAPLGLYQRADTTQQVANDATTIVVGRVALPVLARSAGDDALLRAGYRTGAGMTTAFVAPVMILTAALASPLLVTVFGDQWHAAGPLLSALSLAGALWPLHLLAHNALYASGHNRTVFEVNLAKKVLAFVAFALGALISLQGAAWAIVGAAALGLLVNARALHRKLELPLREQVAAAAPSLLLASGVGIVVYVTGQMWSPLPVIEVLVLGGSGGLVYLASALLLRTPVLDVVHLLRRRERTPGPLRPGR